MSAWICEHPLFASVADFVKTVRPSQAVVSLQVDDAGAVIGYELHVLTYSVVRADRGYAGEAIDYDKIRETCLLRATRWPDLFARGVS